MTVLNALRRRAFWVLDGILGSPIKSQFQEISSIFENPQSIDSLAIKENNLGNILRHAAHTTPFYKKIGGLGSLEDFPIINKNIILENFDDFRSDIYKNHKLTSVSSSGSTGIPFKIFQDKGKRNRNTADVIYFTEQANGKIGDNLYFLKLWDYKNQKSRLTSWMQNIHAHNVMDTDEEDLKKLLEDLEKDKAPKTILGYPSFFEELCHYLDGLDHHPSIENVNTVISIAEHLNEREKLRMGKYFKCDVFERYSNQENGILAQQTIDKPKVFRLNEASYHFEFLTLGSDAPVGPGEIGRIVVTDLFNNAMPIIRYDTGDLATYELDGDGSKNLTSVQGRRYDAIFDTREKMISPHFLYMILDYGDIRQFQFIQKEQKDYLLRLNAEEGNVQEDKIISFCREHLGNDAEVSFLYVNEIPLLSSGKRKKIVNEYKKS